MLGSSDLCSSLLSTVSCLAAVGVAFFRKYRFKKFQKRSEGIRNVNESLTGIVGVYRGKRLETPA